MLSGKMNKTCLLGLLIVMIFETAAVAAPLTIKPEDAFRRAFPQVQLDSIRPTEIKGLYEVVSGPSILYYFQENDYIFAGDIYNKDRKNLTLERRGELTAKLAGALPLEKAVKIGGGKKVVIEITDPDCPFCRTASEYFSKKEGVTRYVFFAPLSHPEAIHKVHYILGAENKTRAYEDMMHGKEIPKSAPPAGEGVKALAQEHLALARKVGVRGTPTFFIKGQMVVGADLKKIEQLLKD